jgi:hypothetical protein
MGDREKSCFALRSFAPFAVRYWRLLSLPHPGTPGSGAKWENGIGKIGVLYHGFHGEYACVLSKHVAETVIQAAPHPCLRSFNITIQVGGTDRMVT